ncbi:MAG: hypothetical protein ACYSOQ_05955 [Planctomycetota bacterium]|jgi:hypothetical protein
MSKKRKWMAGVVCVVLMALLAPVALAVDICGIVGGTLQLYSGETIEMLDGCVYDHQLTLGNATLTLDGGEITGILNAWPDSTVDIKGGSIGELLYIWQSNTTVYGSGFAVVGLDELDSSVIQIEGGQIGSPLTLTGVYEDGSEISIPFAVEPGSALNLVWLDGPSVIDVVIDIKPDNADNTVNLGSLGVIPVGILSTADFDATQVDPWTVELAGAGVAVRGKGSKLLSSAKDLNGDGLLDLEVKVETENLDPGQFQDGIAVLTGKMYDATESTNGGQEIRGQDTITIIPE